MGCALQDRECWCHVVFTILCGTAERWAERNGFHSLRAPMKGHEDRDPRIAEGADFELAADDLHAALGCPHREPPSHGCRCA